MKVRLLTSIDVEQTQQEKTNLPVPRTIVVAGAITLVVIIGGYFLLRGRYQVRQQKAQPQPTPSEFSTPTQESETATPEAQSEGTSSLDVKEVVVSGTEFSFSPSTISVQPGQTVRVTFQNEGRVGHNLTIQGVGSTSVISPGQSETLEFTAPDSSGVYPIRYECTVPGHAERGMVGSLVVE